MSDENLNDEQLSDEIKRRKNEVPLGEGRYLGLFYEKDDPLYKSVPNFLDALWESKLKVDNWAKEEENRQSNNNKQTGENIELLANPVKAHTPKKGK